MSSTLYYLVFNREERHSEILSAKATQQEKSWRSNPGPWIVKPRLWIMSFASWAQIGSPSVWPMHWSSLWATWTHIHSKKEPSTLMNLWDTNNGLLCQCLGSRHKLKAQNMQIQLPYLCGNESLESILISIAMYLTSPCLGKVRKIKKAEMVRGGKGQEILYNVLTY